MDLFAPVVPARPRWGLALLLLVLPVLGLGSRSRAVPVPAFLAAYAGDTLWTMMMYVGLLFLWPRMPIARVAGLAWGISFLVEFSQLYHVPWLDSVRAHWLGALVLGRGFLASDLVCYTVGVLLAAGVDGLLARRSVVE
ncbi:ribosomal maturation YjgA family protein [Hyalangium versicolor]|uniref:ribosomal maturation YjgA family protein n=1 Tax=Hyalangium versicolor TaxID=2861190 RepID=UPI001CCCC640|nr:DUF2809 domain-containing protein [Hyalangium versicolor]